MGNGHNYWRSFPLGLTIFFTIQGSAIVVLNVLSVMVFRRKRGALRRTTYFLVNLAFADALVGTAEVVTAYIHPSVDFTDFLIAMSSLASLISLSTISLERLLATWKPLWHRVCPSKYYFVIIGVNWCCAVLDGVLYMKYVDGRLAKNVVLSWLLATSFALLLGTILISYTAIWSLVMFRPRPGHLNREQGRKLTRTLCIVTALSVLTWTPAIVTTALADKNLSWEVHAAKNTLLFANSLVNPIVYIFRMQEFREELNFLCALARQ